MNDQHKYTEHHLWIQAEPDGTFKAGITDHAQQMLGDIVFIEAPSVGARLQAGTACGVVESVKTASDLHAPLDGEVLAINAALSNSPEQLNEKAEQTWIFIFRADRPEDARMLMDASTYLASLK